MEEEKIREEKEEEGKEEAMGGKRRMGWKMEGERLCGCQERQRSLC